MTLPKLAFIGDSHAAIHLRNAATDKGFAMVERDAADVVFIAEDTPTNADGERYTAVIHDMATGGALHYDFCTTPMVVTSQVRPGFCRALARDVRGRDLFHQSETLRIKDAAHRAANPEMFIVGCEEPEKELPAAYLAYLNAFDCPILKMSYESAEYAKLAINAFLISQVETTNMLARLARKCGAEWRDVAEALRHDSRIGLQAYLEPGRWDDSIHLKRDFLTLREIAGFDQQRLLDSWA